ncbi:von Willebrand factor D and EGF domain-containing protein-like [Glandiceps talaboti]
MKKQCVEVISKDTTFWNEEDGTLIKPNLCVILQNFCYRDCNGNGTCNNCTCSCNAGLGGIDCSVDLSIPPDVNGGHKNGLCDTKFDDCTYVSIWGGNIIDTNDLTCSRINVQISAKGFETTTELETINESGTSNSLALFNSYEQVRCPSDDTPSTVVDKNITKPSGSLYMLSNDGKMKSAAVLVIKYNSNCDICNGTAGSCTRRDNICVFDDDCFDKDHLVCQESPLAHLIKVAGSTIFAILIAVTIITIVVLAVRHMKMKSKVGTAPAPDNGSAKSIAMS